MSEENKKNYIEVEYNGEKFNFSLPIIQHYHQALEEVLNALINTASNPSLKNKVIRYYNMYEIALYFNDIEPLYIKRKFNLLFLDNPYVPVEKRIAPQINDKTFKDLIFWSGKNLKKTFKNNFDKLFFLADKVEGTDIKLIDNAFKITTGLELKDDSLYFENKEYIQFREDLLLELEAVAIKNEGFSKKDLHLWLKEKLNKPESDYIKLLKVEAESYYLGIIDILHHQYYRKIRHSLTKEEKRLFVLSFFMRHTVLGKPSPSLPFGNMIPAYHKMFLDFWCGTDEYTRWLIAKGIIYKDKSASIELTDRWRAYLKFYPFWLKISREDDAIQKSNERRKSEELPESDIIKENEEGDEFCLINNFPDKKSSEELAKDFESYLVDLPNEQANIIRWQFLNGFNQKEIAQKLNITQQAVSKKQKEAIKNIRAIREK